MSVPRQTLSKNERLKSYKRIRLLFAEGQKFKVQSLLVYYQPHPQHAVGSDEFYLQMGVSVGARYFKRAVDRNLLKRRIREVYRKNNGEVKKVLSEHNYCLDIFFVYAHAEILSYNQLESSMQKALQLLSDKINHISISKA